MKRLLIPLTLLLGLAAPAAAFECSTRADQLDAELDRYVVQLEAAARALESAGIAGTDGIRTTTAELAFQLAQMDAAGRAELCSQLAAHEDLAAIPERLTRVAAIVSTAVGDRADGCFALPPDVWQELFLTTQALELSAVIAGGLCGATGCITLVCVGPCIFAGIAQSAAVVSAAAMDRSDYCQSIESALAMTRYAADTDRELTALEDVLDRIEPQADVELGTRVSEESLAATQGAVETGFSSLGDVAEALDAVATAQAEHDRQAADDATGSLIEVALQGSLNGPVVTLALPAAAGGQLEQVRERVSTAILTYGGLGVDTGDALALFAQGDRAFNRDQYLAAFNAYRAAYRSVIGGGA